MEMTQNVAAWLSWLSRVRFFLITLLFALVFVLGKTSQLEVSTRYFIPLMILWYMLAIVYSDLDAVDARGRLARGSSAGIRSAGCHVPDLSDGNSGQLFHLALPAGHYRRQYFVFSQSDIHGGGFQFYFARGTRRTHLLQHSSTHADCGSYQPAVADLDFQQFVLFLGRRVPIEPAGAEPAPPQRRTGS